MTATNVNTNTNTYMSEEQVETALIDDLVTNGYQQVRIADETELLRNFRTQFTHHNRHIFTPTHPLTDNEWSHVLTALSKSRSIHDRTLYINEPQTLPRDDRTTIHYTFVNPHNPTNNIYQVAQQTTMKNRYEIRYDVTLLINGVPLIVIELKKPGKALKDAHGQITRYHKQASGLYRYTRMYIISNFVNTRYYAANTDLPDLHAAFTWAREDNTHINSLLQFTETFLTPTHITKMLFRYTVLNHTRQTLMVLRPYQVYAAEAIVKKVDTHSLPQHSPRNTPASASLPATLPDTTAPLTDTSPAEPSQTLPEGTQTPEHSRYIQTPAPTTQTRHNPPVGIAKAGGKGGVIWHTTGSGKTLTSFTTAQLLTRNPNIDKIVFVVDRNDLDYQTQREFNSFQPGSVDGTSDTKTLMRQLTDPNTKLVITTIQKLNNATKHPTRALRDIAAHHNFVFLFDECHRSQFGDTHQRINEFFTNKYFFGFTGTPIFAKNHIQKRTTEDIFGPILHAYIIKDGISDGSVLPFTVEYVEPVTTTPKPTPETPTPTTNPATPIPANPTPNQPLPYSTDQWYRNVAEFIVDNHHTKTFYNHKTKNFIFQAILATDSVPSAIEHYNRLWRLYTTGKSKIKPAVIYTYDPNSAYDYTPQPDDTPSPDTPATTTETMSARDKLEEAITNYNLLYNTNHTLQDNGFAAYYQDVGKKLREGDINLLIVVNMFLTGYDNPTLNTLYVDKNLQYHTLIQAFSRTNRVLFTREGGRDAPAKPYGNIVTFRPLKTNIDEAIALYADPDASSVIIRKPYNRLREKLIGKTLNLTSFAPTPETVDILTSEEAKTEYARLFRTLLATHNEISTYTAYTHDVELAENTLPYAVFLSYKTKYVDLRDAANELKRKQPDTASPLTEFDFDLVSLRSETINVDYIVKLIHTLHRETVLRSETHPPGQHPHNTTHPADTPELAAKLARLNEIIDALDDDDPKKEWLKKYVNIEVFPTDKPLPPLKEFNDYLAERREEKLAELAAKLHLPTSALSDAYTRYLYDSTLDASDLRLLADPKPATLREKTVWRRRLEEWFTYIKITFDE